MHVIALHLAPILGAEKNRTVFYIFAGALACWAVLLSVGLGLRNPNFPGGIGGQRLVISISATLVIGTMASGVITSGSPAKTAGQNTTASLSTSEPASKASSQADKTPRSSAAANAPGTSTALKLAANPEGQLAYNTKQLQAKAGEVTITMTNMAPEAHNVTIAQGTHVLGATPTFQGGSKTLKLDLKPGTYTFYCSVPGHRQAGMEGTLTVS
jgi:plastocyanin